MRRPGRVVIRADVTFEDPAEGVRAAAGEPPISVVARAGASGHARMAGHEIPAGRGAGVSQHDDARRMLDAPAAAGIHAPVRPRHLLGRRAEGGGDHARARSRPITKRSAGRPRAWSGPPRR